MARRCAASRALSRKGSVSCEPCSPRENSKNGLGRDDSTLGSFHESDYAEEDTVGSAGVAGSPAARVPLCLQASGQCHLLRLRADFGLRRILRRSLAEPSPIP